MKTQPTSFVTLFKLLQHLSHIFEEALDHEAELLHCNKF